MKYYMVRLCAPLAAVLSLALVTPRIALADGLDEDFFFEEEDFFEEEEFDFEEKVEEVEEEIFAPEETFGEYEGYELEDDLLLQEGYAEYDFEEAAPLAYVELEAPFEEEEVFVEYGYEEYEGDYGAVFAYDCSIDTRVPLGIDCDLWSLRLVGLVQGDAVFLNSSGEEGVAGGVSNPFEPSTSSANIRRGYLGVAGTYYDNWEYQFVAEIGSGGIYEDENPRGGIESAWLRYRSFEGITATAGFIKLPFGLAHSGRPAFDLFMERPFFNEQYRMGVLVGFEVPEDQYGIRGKLDVAAHLGSHNANRTDVTADNVGVAGRFVVLPYVDENRGTAFQLGLGGRYVNMNGGDSAFEVESGLFGAQPFSGILRDHFYAVNDINAGSFYVVNPEARFIYGPLSVQVEYIHLAADLDEQFGRDLGEFDFRMWYAQANLWLTGEDSVIDSDTWSTGRIVPLRSFFQGGEGAIGIGARFQQAFLYDTTDGETIDRGKVEGFTFNLTWKPNPFVKFMGEYVRAWHQDSVAGKGHPYAVQFRMQFDW